MVLGRLDSAGGSSQEHRATFIPKEMIASFLSLHSLDCHTGLLYGTSQRCGVFAHTHLHLHEYRLCYNFTEHGLANTIAESFESRRSGAPELVGWFFVGNGNGVEQAEAISRTMQTALVRGLATAFCRKYDSRMAQPDIAKSAHDFFCGLVGIMMLRGVVNAGAQQGDLYHCETFYLQSDAVTLQRVHQEVKDCYSSARFGFHSDCFETEELQPVSPHEDSGDVVNLVSDEDEGEPQQSATAPLRMQEHEKPTPNAQSTKPTEVVSRSLPATSGGSHAKTEGSHAMPAEHKAARVGGVETAEMRGAGSGPPLSRCMATATGAARSRSPQVVEGGRGAGGRGDGIAKVVAHRLEDLPLVSDVAVVGEPPVALGPDRERGTAEGGASGANRRTQLKESGTWLSGDPAEEGEAGTAAQKADERCAKVESALYQLREDLSGKTSESERRQRPEKMKAASGHGVVQHRQHKEADADGNEEQETAARPWEMSGLRSERNCDGRSGLWVVPGVGLELLRGDDPRRPFTTGWMGWGEQQAGDEGRGELAKVMESALKELQGKISMWLQRAVDEVLSGEYRVAYDGYNALWSEMAEATQGSDLREGKVGAVRWDTRVRGSMELQDLAEEEKFVEQMDSFEVVMDHCVLAQVVELCLNDGLCEVVGVLWGQMVEPNLLHVRSCSLIERNVWDTTVGTVSWSFLDFPLEDERMRVGAFARTKTVSALGWFHSHVGPSPVPSEVDCASQGELQRQSTGHCFGLLCAVWGSGQRADRMGRQDAAHNIAFTAFCVNDQDRPLRVRWEVREQVCMPPSVLAESFRALQRVVEENQQLYSGRDCPRSVRRRARTSRWLEFLERFYEESLGKARAQALQHRKNVAVWHAHLRPRAAVARAAARPGQLPMPRQVRAERSVHGLNQGGRASGTVLVAAPPCALVEAVRVPAEGPGDSGVEGAGRATAAGKGSAKQSGEAAEGERGRVEGRGKQPVDFEERSGSAHGRRGEVRPDEAEELQPGKEPKRAGEDEDNEAGAAKGGTHMVSDEEMAKKLDRELNGTKAESLKAGVRRTRVPAEVSEVESDDDDDFLPAGHKKKPKKK